MINLRKTLSDAHSVLEQAGVAHALIGNFALASYGQHRATSDIDLLADGTKKEIIKTELIKKGFVLKHESSEVLQFSGIGFLDILLANRPLSQEMLKRAKRNSELNIYILKPEDIIGLKKITKGEVMSSMEEYFQFLEQYWQMFEPPTEQQAKVEYKNILI